MHAAVLDHRQLELDLRAALDRDEFFLVYQPICSLETRAVTGVEALIRWQHPSRGVVYPDVFIPLLEETGMIVEVGRWVLRTACRASGVVARTRIHLDLAVNVSGKQLDHDSFVIDVHETLASTRLEPSSLTLEITESVAMRDTDDTATRLAEFKALGVRVAIDDFGTGYSSLAHLRQFPVDALEDRSFVHRRHQRIARDGSARAHARAARQDACRSKRSRKASRSTRSSRISAASTATADRAS